MADHPRSLNIVMKRAGVSFFTQRVLQRWQRGEIDTDEAVELLQTDDAVRMVRVWPAVTE